MGRVMTLQPRKDEIIREVKLKPSNHELCRSVVNIATLDVEPKYIGNSNSTSMYVDSSTTSNKNYYQSYNRIYSLISTNK